MLKNIIIINDSASIKGGAEKVAIQSAFGLSECGYNVILFTAIGPIDPELKNHNIKVICLNQYDILNDPNRLRAIRQGLWNKKAKKIFKQTLTEFSPHDTIIHFHSWTKALSPSLFNVTRKLSFPIVITSHEYFTVCPNGGFFDYKHKKICTISPLSYNCLKCNCDVRSYPQKIWRFIRQLIFKRTFLENKIFMIFISDLTERVILSHIGKYIVKHYRLTNPIELNQHKPVNITQNDTYIFIGRLSEEKGAELFCKVITELGLKGCILGQGYLFEELKNKYSTIKFAGWVTGKDKEELIRKGKALVFPSLWYEGAPLTIMEMKSYGIPCIVPDKCAASEEITDGKTGLIFKSGNYNSLKAAIEKYEKSNIQEYQNNIISSFSAEKYSLSNHLNGLLEIYNNILSLNKQNHI
jgi:glycosyltransferase involved in cell wall biosynthesis